MKDAFPLNGTFFQPNEVSGTSLGLLAMIAQHGNAYLYIIDYVFLW